MFSKQTIIVTTKYYFTILLLFLFVFGIPFNFLPINSSKMVFAFLGSLLILKVLSKSKLKLSINKNILFFSFYLLFMVVISLIATVGNNAMDFSIPYTYFIFLVESLFGSYLFYSFLLKNYTFEKFLHLFIVISLIQSFIIIGMFIFEPFRDLIFSISKEGAMELMARYGGFRGFGLASSLTYDLAVFLSISMIFIAYLTSQSSVNRTFYLLSWVIIFIAVLMTGRTGWIGVFLSLVILFMNFTNKNSLKSFVYLLGSIILIVIILIYILDNYFPEIYNTLILSVVPYAFEMFINFYDIGSFTTSSSDHLPNMYYGLSEHTYLFGDGYWVTTTGNGYYGRTDAGYMRHALFYGLFGSMLLYIFYGYGFYEMYQSMKKTFNNLLLIGMLCGFYFLAHYKGDFLTGSPINIKLFSMLLVYLLLNKQKKLRCYNMKVSS